MNIPIPHLIITAPSLEVNKPVKIEFIDPNNPDRNFSCNSVIKERE